ncbi:MAG: redox-regulated ATPase YchF [Chloroflexi bacterium RBG_13_46_14]|nr:MAG: redox-regulated ATPase YchF [Chloroflexi bacterium RBG_13_46_14]
MEIGIIGLPQSGRTIVFNALTEGGSSGRASSGTAAHIGTAVVPEPRLEVLAGIFHPGKVTYPSVTYIDIGASLKDMAQDKGIGGKLLNQLSQVDALINVVRAFKNDAVPHTEGSLDVERDITNMNLELIFSDLVILERRLSRLGESLKAARQAERAGILREQEAIGRIKADLEQDIPVREMNLTEEEKRMLSGYQLLSAKPLVIAVNIGEEQLPEADNLIQAWNSKFKGEKRAVTAICGELEMELTRLDGEAAEEFRSEYGLKESGSERIIRLSYDLLGLISFFTTGSDEVKAWSVKEDTEAMKAAGKIHTDLEKGFIRAEVISYDDFIKCGSMAEAKKQGLIRLEGKTYPVKDGDLITVLFNV